MEYKKKYFESGQEYKSKRGLHNLKKIFPRKFFEKKSRIHYNLILHDRWKKFAKSKNILDAGCGKCEFISLNPYNKKIYGIDINLDAIKIGSERGFKVKYADVTRNIPFKDNTFDSIIFSHVLEHLESPVNTINEFKRVLKNKGKIMIIVPNLSFKRFHDDYTHKKLYTKLSLYRLLRDFEFEDIKIENGPMLNQLISALFFQFPRLRLKIEKLLGKISPFEIIVTAKNTK